MTTTVKGRARPEPPQAIFDRINRRRAARRTAALAGVVPPASAPAPLRIDELVDVGPGPGSSPPDAEQIMRDTFPRSATIRTLLRHPAAAVGVGVPAAVLLLSNPAARRLLRAGLVLGARPEVRAVVGAALAAAGNALDKKRPR